MHRNVIETVLGGVVLAVAFMFIVFAYTNSEIRAVGGYDVIAKFGRVDGLKVGDDIRLSGMKVGSVQALGLDRQGYAASVTMRIDSHIKLPTDSAVAVHTEGLLGGKFLELAPGGDEAFVEPGGVLSFSQDAVILEELLEKIVAIARENEKKSGEGEGEAPAKSDDPFATLGKD